VLQLHRLEPKLNLPDKFQYRTQY